MSLGKTFRSLAAQNVLYVCAVVLAGATVHAQQISGSIRGSVSDPTGAIVQSASVTAIQTETGLKRTVGTDREGRYLIVELPVGHYRLEVEAQGFRKYVQRGISLNLNQTATITVHLAVGTTNQQVEVQADAQLIEATVTSLGKTVLENDVVNLPLNGRNF